MIIHQFKDLENIPFLFDKETERIFFQEFVMPSYKIILSDGYLARTLKEKYFESILYGKIEYFHRFIMKKELEEKGKHLHVHHKDGNKHNNQKDNLELIEEKEHYSHHKEEKYHKGFATWCEKVYGYIDYGHYDEFNEWLEKKQEEDYYG